jgi:hypothetical protein
MVGERHRFHTQSNQCFRPPQTPALITPTHPLLTTNPKPTNKPEAGESAHDSCRRPKSYFQHPHRMLTSISGSREPLPPSGFLGYCMHAHVIAHIYTQRTNSRNWSCVAVAAAGCQWPPVYADFFHSGEVNTQHPEHTSQAVFAIRCAKWCGNRRVAWKHSETSLYRNRYMSFASSASWLKGSYPDFQGNLVEIMVKQDTGCW